MSIYNAKFISSSKASKVQAVLQLLKNSIPKSPSEIKANRYEMGKNQK
jgi:hypothetical protein